MTAFGPFRLDAANQRLYRGPTAIRLTSKAAGILELLISRPNELVTHDDLLDSLWAGVHVQPEVLKVYIAELRRALRDSADKPSYIETVHRRGYRFLYSPEPPRAAGTAEVAAERLVGRSREMAFLQKSFRRAGKGSRRLVFLSGEPGIGKTALLNAFMLRIGHRPGVCGAIGHVAHSIGETEPFSPVLDALPKVLAAEHGPQLKAALRQFAPGWMLQFPSLREFADSAKFGKDLTGVKSQTMSREFAEAIETFCQDVLLVLGLDDMEHADSSTLDLLEFLMSRKGPLKLLVVAAVNDQADSEPVHSLITDLKVRRVCEEVKLGPLAEESVKRFLEHKYPSSRVGAVLAAQIHRLSAGVPLFFSSALHYMESQGWLLKTKDGWVPSVDALSLPEFIPPALTELVELRIRQLPAEDQSTLEAASIAGLEFGADAVSDALRRSAGDVEEACNRMVRQSGWLQFSGFASSDDGRVLPRFRFAHELFREILYSRQPPPERVLRHERIAEGLERTPENGMKLTSPGPASWHGVHHGSKGIHYLMAAAQNAERRYGGGEAAALLSKALRLAGSLTGNARTETELDVLNNLGEAYFTSGDFFNAGLSWHKALRKAMVLGRTDTAVGILSRLAFPLGWGNLTRLLKVSEAVLAGAPNIQDPLLRADVTLRSVILCAIAGTFLPAHAALVEDALKQIAEAHDPVRTASARISNAALRLIRSEYRGAIQDLEESLPVALRRGSELVRAEWWLSWALFHAGDLGRSQSVVTSALEHAQKNGNRRVEALFTTLRAWLHLECGAFGSARSLCRHAMELHDSHGVGATMCLVVSAMTAIELRDADSAIACMDQVFSKERFLVNFWRPLAETVVLRAHLIKRNIPEGVQAARRVEQALSGMAEKTWKAVALNACAEAASEDGRTDVARGHTAEALQLVNSQDLPLAKWKVEAVAARLFGGSEKDAASFSSRSNDSRRKLLDSLGTRDPLRSFGLADDSPGRP